MTAVIALVGVALGAALGPLLEWARERRAVRELRRTELLELVAGLISTSGDRILAEDPNKASGPDSLEIAFRANNARWRLRLLAPTDIAAAAERYGRASTALTRHLSTTQTREDEQHEAWVTWRTAAEDLLPSPGSTSGVCR